MKSKERVLAALSWQEPDRVPMDYIANPGIDRRLKVHLGLAPGDDEGLRRTLGIDFRHVGLPEYVGPQLHAVTPGVRTNMWGVRSRWVEHETGGYWDYCGFPLRNATEEQIERWPMPSPDDFDYAGFAARCATHADYCVVAGHAGVGDIINGAGMLRTMEQTLMDLALDEPAGLRLIDRKLAVVAEIIRRALEAACGKVDLLWLGEDLGTQRGPTISLDLFRRHIRPRHQRLVDLARRRNIPVAIHSCGSSSWAFDDFIDMGIRVVDTLQPEATDMAPAYLKRRFGGRVAFHGMISTAGPVAYGGIDDVVRDVRDTLDIMMPGGGYCLAPTHELQDNSPAENVVAMYEEARRYGEYRRLGG